MGITRIFYVKWVPGYADGITLPPLGILIERRYKWDDKLLKHEKGHWAQYQEWGFIKYYYTVIRDYLKYGPGNGPIEADADRRGKDL